jgi:hypothetical protein
MYRLQNILGPGKLYVSFARISIWVRVKVSDEHIHKVRVIINISSFTLHISCGCRWINLGGN